MCPVRTCAEGFPVAVVNVVVGVGVVLVDLLLLCSPPTRQFAALGSTLTSHKYSQKEVNQGKYKKGNLGIMNKLNSLL